MSRPSSPRAVLPPTDHVARELLKRGAREPAILLLRAAVRRDPGERACAALIKALEARPDAAVSGPELALDLALVDDYVVRGMLLEARAVLAGGGLDGLGPGADRARALDELLAPMPDGADLALVEVFRHLMTGGASLSLSLVEEHVQKGSALPPWAARRRTLLRSVLLDRALESAVGAADAATAPGNQPAPVALASAGTNLVAAEVGRLIGERDLRGAAARLQAYCASAPYDVSASVGAAALVRLVRALELRDAAASEVVDTRTMPMGPKKVAELHLRMGNLAESEGLFRRVVLEEPENAELRAMLDDVQSVRRFLEAPVATAPTLQGATLRQFVDAGAAEIGVRPTEPLPVVTDDLFGEPTEEDGPEELPRLYTDISQVESGEITAELPTRPEETTRRVSAADLARSAAASMARPDVQADAPMTAPMLSKKGAGLSGGFGVATGYGPAKSEPSSADWDDDATGVVEPAVEAELLLQQGFHARALATYRMLLERNPSDAKLARRVAEIEALVVGEPLPSSADVTVQRDVSHLWRASLPTGARLHVPEDVRVAAAAVGAAALPGTLAAPDIPQGQFDDDAPTGIAVGGVSRPVAPAAAPAAPAAPATLSPSGTAAVSVTRIVVVR
jgi:hypothetical protein